MHLEKQMLISYESYDPILFTLGVEPALRGTSPHGLHELRAQDLIEASKSKESKE
jgi:hypothetical protein